MSNSRGATIAYDQPATQPNNDMILSFTTQSASFPPGNSMMPLGHVPPSAASPGSIVDMNVILINRTGTVSTLRVQGDAVAAVTDEVFTVEKNGADTAIVATAAVGASLALDATHSAAVVAGDVISLRHNANATPTFAQMAGSIYFTPS